MGGVRHYLKKRYLADHFIEVLSSNSSSYCKEYRKITFFAFLKRKQYLSSKEIVTICCLLEDFLRVISEETPNRDYLIKLRMELERASMLVRKRVNNKSRILLADRVEHFNQSDHGKFFTIEQVVSGL
ncbi:hypothetical protein [Xenorhabdus szentirmaii]|uniref:hypothetical protein n=1 Tax=Xenorhabdus szentirmaii TaxID=290112 RepID=UPI0019CB5790|nr:hypothetical protein [Xenorhabdus sp. 38]MBD2782881.1 hypothetical protein [Xenorhabdus sp. 38]